jgi:hypothetical protein
MMGGFVINLFYYTIFTVVKIKHTIFITQKKAATFPLTVRASRNASWFGH